MLESFGLRVQLYDLTRKRDALLFLSGETADCEYVILCAHGCGGATIGLKLLDQKDGDYENPEGWEAITLSLTPQSIPELVCGKGRTLICGACGGGNAALVEAFLAAGFRAYIASEEPVFGNAGLLFLIGFFYHRLSVCRIDAKPTCRTDEEAVALAAALDTVSRDGTYPFPYFAPTASRGGARSA